METKLVKMVEKNTVYDYTQALFKDMFLLYNRTQQRSRDFKIIFISSGHYHE